MSTAAIATIVKMVEDLPEDTQQQVVDHLREYLEDIQDEQQWNAAFARTQPALADAAHHARQEIAAGKAKPLHLDEL